MRRDGIRHVDTRADAAGRELPEVAAPTALRECISQSPAGDGGAFLFACERSGQRCHFPASDKAETNERRTKED